MNVKKKNKNQLLKKNNVFVILLEVFLKKRVKENGFLGIEEAVGLDIT